MRVLYLNPFSQQVSGPDESLLTLLEALIPMGVEPHILLPKPGPPVARYQTLGAKIHFAPLTILKRRMGPTDLARLAPHLTRGVAAVSRIARTERIDLIHTNMEVVLDGAFASRRLRLPHVLHYRGNTLDRPRVVFDLLTRFWTATSDRILCISEATADIFRKRGLGAKVEVIHNPIDVDAFVKAEPSAGIRRELGAGPGDLLVGTVGRLHPRKDLATFLRTCALAAQYVENLRFVVVGTAEAPEEIVYHNQLMLLAQNSGIDERFCWAGARRDMPLVLKAFDLFILCSRHEGFGRVVAEAMAAGVPVIVTREGALPELITDEQTGLSAPPANPAAFADCLLRLARDERLRREMSRRASSAAQRFHPRAGALKILKVYHSTWNGHHQMALQ